MTGADRVRVLEEAAELDVEMMQFIGGEPMVHPDLPFLIDHAVGRVSMSEVICTDD